MDGKFTDFVIRELRELLSDMEAGLAPANIVLSEQITAELRKQYERQGR